MIEETDMKLLFIFLLIGLFSCSDGYKNTELLMINLDEISYEPMDISAVADSVIYIQFDNSFILPGFVSLHWADSCFFVNTREGVLKYDTRGRFLCKIGDIGDGPKEYPRYSYRCIMDKSNEVIYIYVYSEQKLLSPRSRACAATSSARAIPRSSISWKRSSKR